MLSLVDGRRLSLCRLRRNATYQDLAEDFGVAVSTAWAYHQLMVGLLAAVLGCHPDELGVLVAGKVCLVDGTRVPTFNWRHRRDLFSGKHRRYGVNLQLAADLHGRLVGVSPAHPGSWHDTHCFRAAGWDSLLAGAGGDLGYEGTRLITPKTRPAGGKLTEPDRIFNTRLATIRVAAERSVAHLKNWRIITTRYRFDRSRIDTDIQAVSGLQRLNERTSSHRLTYNRIKRAELSE